MAELIIKMDTSNKVFSGYIDTTSNIKLIHNERYLNMDEIVFTIFGLVFLCGGISAGTFIGGSNQITKIEQNCVDYGKYVTENYVLTCDKKPK